MGELRILGAVEMVLGLMDVSLAAALLQVQTYLKTELAVLFVTGGLSALVGLSLVFGGQKPSYACLKFNMAFNLSVLLLSAVSLGSVVRYVPYREERFCKDDCHSSCSSTLVLLRSILAILVTILLMQTLVSLVAAVQGYCCMMLDYSKPPGDNHGMSSHTSERLCVPPELQALPAYNSTMDGQPEETPRLTLAGGASSPNGNTASSKELGP